MTLKIDFVKELPTEITELILSYLNGIDVLACCKVSLDWCDILDRESSWRILCRKQKWSKEDGEINSWRDCYWLNYNWRNGVYRSHQQNVPEGGCLQIGLNEQLVITSHVMGSQIWKFISSSPKLCQDIYCGDFHFQTKTSGKSLVIKLRDSMQLYVQEKQNDRYYRIKTISTDCETELNMNTAVIQTGCDRLVVIQKEIKQHKILSWNLIDGVKNETMYLDDSVKHIFKIIITNNKLYLVILKGNEYKIKIYNFIENRWSLEITAFKNVAFGVIPPELQVSERLIVGFCPMDIDRDLCYGYSPLKVWNSSGSLINSVILNSGRIDYFAFCLSNDLVVYRYSESIVKVWKPETDESVYEFKVQSEVCKIDKSIDSLLVLTYDRYFDVWDYKLGKKLYTVKTVDDTDSVIHDRIEINKYYYAKQNRNKKIVTVFSFTDQIGNTDQGDQFITSECNINTQQQLDFKVR